MTLTIDWNEFTPLASLLGGALIGLAAVMLVAFKGRILGISGIVGSMLQTSNTPKDHFRWRLYFIAGILISSLSACYLGLMPPMQIKSDFSTLVAGGLLVGFGTRMGSGCTSGHAVCGLGRLSLRSLTATLVFMGSGFLTAYVFYHLA